MDVWPLSSGLDEEGFCDARKVRRIWYDRMQMRHMAPTFSARSVEVSHPAIGLIINDAR